MAPQLSYPAIGWRWPGRLRYSSSSATTTQERYIAAGFNYFRTRELIPFIFITAKLMVSLLYYFASLELLPHNSHNNSPSDCTIEPSNSLRELKRIDIVHLLISLYIDYIYSRLISDIGITVIWLANHPQPNSTNDRVYGTQHYVELRVVFRGFRV